MKKGGALAGTTGDIYFYKYNLDNQAGAIKLEL